MANDVRRAATRTPKPRYFFSSEKEPQLIRLENTATEAKTKPKQTFGAVCWS
uniref:Uncharacterized protein n=1 Tax=Haemonchus contortus TaxID=6289 RepID=A0A7I5EBU0_HAECO